MKNEVENYAPKAGERVWFYGREFLMQRVEISNSGYGSPMAVEIRFLEVLKCEPQNTERTPLKIDHYVNIKDAPPIIIPEED